MYEQVHKVVRIHRIACITLSFRVCNLCVSMFKMLGIAKMYDVNTPVDTYTWCKVVEYMLKSIV